MPHSADHERAHTDRHGQSGDPLDTVFTLPNLITLLRFMLIPIFIFLLVDGQRTAAFVVFCVAGCTDWIDGTVARATNQVSRIGKLFDPLIDRLLIATGVISIFAVGAMPFWPIVVILARDTVLVIGAERLRILCEGATVPVMFVGKVTTAFLLSGFGSLILDWPIVPGLGLLESSLLPGFDAAPCALGTFFVYIGVILSVSTGVVYIKRGLDVRREYLAAHPADGS